MCLQQLQTSHLKNNIGVGNGGARGALAPPSCEVGGLSPLPQSYTVKIIIIINY